MLVEQPRQGRIETHPPQHGGPGDPTPGAAGSRYARSAGYSISMEGTAPPTESLASMLVE
ncbi:hypothetical protein C1I64_17850 [Rathayibacter festucae DSM 15932]|uniref:Uncharacterized protein n=1 Tax=Rathayibacter festucae DSM 15932 TaxID=1328866 RepID=A0A3T0T524_9MICO|nr:hypothetical protein C1I64_17850 [Rathayibacter festucae DSM 15932]